MASERGGQLRPLIVSLSTYTAPYNDGKIEHLGPRLSALTVVAGRRSTLWGEENYTRAGPGYQVHVLPVRFARSNATAKLVGLEELAEAVQPTIVHVECEPWQTVAAQALKLAQRLDIPIGIQFAEAAQRLTGMGGALRRVRGSWMLQRCAYAVGWSAASTRVAQRLVPGIRTDTFPATGASSHSGPPSSADQWFGSDSETLPKLAFVGRFAEQKGVRDFLDVCDELARHLPLRAAIAGGEGEWQLVDEWAEKRSWAFLHGIVPRPAIGSLLSAADALVCPSRTTRFVQEQFGKAAAEAMAVGTPVFAYDCGALAETIGPGGVVVAEGAQDQLVEEIERYFASSATDRMALAERARSQAMLFADEVIAEKLINLWSTCSGPAT
jgi:glycosyltransferase involved in cell wall biosynthesis